AHVRNRAHQHVAQACFVLDDQDAQRAAVTGKALRHDLDEVEPGSAADAAAGRRTTKRLPRPGPSLCATICPPWFCTIACVIDNPNPVPGSRAADAPAAVGFGRAVKNG